MHISWHGGHTVRIQTRDGTIVLDPHDSSTGRTAFRGKADVVALTNPGNGAMSHLEGIQGDPIIIKSPGEYSIESSILHAHGWHDENGNERSLQRWEIESLVLLHVGGLNRDLTDEELQELEQTNIDILILPVGGGSSLTTKQALSLLSKIEPRLVIPTNFAVGKGQKDLSGVKQFAKEMGVSPSKIESKVTVKSSKLPQDELSVVILSGKS